MSGSHQPGQHSIVTVVEKTDATVTFSIKDMDDLQYFPVGAKFSAFFTPIAGDSSGAEDTQS